MEQNEKQRRLADNRAEWASLWYVLDDEDKSILYGMLLSKRYPRSRREWQDLTEVVNLSGVHILG